MWFGGHRTSFRLFSKEYHAETIQNVAWQLPGTFLFDLKENHRLSIQNMACLLPATLLIALRIRPRRLFTEWSNSSGAPLQSEVWKLRDNGPILSTGN